MRPSQAAVSLRPRYLASGSSAGPGRALPTLDASEGKFVPLVLKKCQVNSEPERETAAVPRGASQTNSSRRGEGRWANVCALNVVALLGEEAARG